MQNWCEFHLFIEIENKNENNKFFFMSFNYRVRIYGSINTFLKHFYRMGGKYFKLNENYFLLVSVVDFNFVLEKEKNKISLQVKVV